MMRLRTPPIRTAASRTTPSRRNASVSAKVSYLSDTDIFRDLTSHELDELERMTTMTTCKKRKVFYTPGETGEVLFILKRGRVSLHRINPEGKKLVVATIEPGSVFGEMSLVGQGMYDTFAEAVEECTLCVMSRSDVEHLLLSKPRVAVRFMEMMAIRLQEMEARMENVAFKSVSARLAALLLELAEDGEISGVSHQELADMIGTYRETVTRILNELRTGGCIKLGRLKVTILRGEELETIAES